MKIKNKKRFILISSVCAVLIIASALFLVFSKYIITNNGENHLQAASEFHFESDQLTEPVGEVVVTHHLYNYDKEQDYNFTINLRNYSDALNISSLGYTSTISADNTSVTFSLKKPIVFPASTKSSQDITVTVPATTTLTDNKVTITATANQNYYKQIKATFELHSSVALTPTLRAEKHGTYVDLFISTGSGGLYNIKWPSGLSPDNTNELLTSFLDSNQTTTGQEITGTGKYESLRFFITGGITDSKFYVRLPDETKYTEVVF